LDCVGNVGWINFWSKLQGKQQIFLHGRSKVGMVETIGSTGGIQALGRV
jgi:hypothetical protein